MRQPAGFNNKKCVTQVKRNNFPTVLNRKIITFSHSQTLEVGSMNLKSLYFDISLIESAVRARFSSFCAKLRVCFERPPLGISASHVSIPKCDADFFS